MEVEYVEVIRTKPSEVLIPIDIAHHSEMISPTVPI